MDSSAAMSKRSKAVGGGASLLTAWTEVLVSMTPGSAVIVVNAAAMQRAGLAKQASFDVRIKIDRHSHGGVFRSFSFQPNG